MQKIGAYYLGEGRYEFTVWAPLLSDLTVHILPDRRLPLAKNKMGYFQTVVDDLSPDSRYLYITPDSAELPDPASFFQPDGIETPSLIIDHSSFPWTDHEWEGIPQAEMIIYELHVGTFTEEGTFDGVISRLPYLADLGINTIELMPVAQFPGTRNWGYDGVFPFAVQNSYGGPFGLKRLVNACHEHNISIILDVVYNHLGPEGNCLHKFMPVFTDKYTTPWGKAINFDDAYSFGVRNFFIQNALYWLREFHIDGLRLDALHGIFDMSAKHFLRELAEHISLYSLHSKKKHYLFAEDDLNRTQIIEPFAQGGFGLDATWNDDFHHALHTILTGETERYYEDFGSMDQLVTAIREGYVYSWEYSKYRKRFQGSFSANISPKKFIVFAQNHDQVGNRPQGERLSTLVDIEQAKLAAALVLLSPNTPLLFMGEEYGEQSPFLFFVDFHDIKIIQSMLEGRKREIGEYANPADEKTFLASRLKWSSINEEPHKMLFAYYKELIRIRKTIAFDSTRITHNINNQLLTVLRYNLFLLINFSNTPVDYRPQLEDNWIKELDSCDTKWQGPGSPLPYYLPSQLVVQPKSACIYMREQ